MPKIDELKDRLLAINNQAQTVRKKAEDEGRDLTVEEASELDQLLASHDHISADIQRLERLETQTQQMLAGRGRLTEPDRPMVTGDDGDGNPQTQRLNTPAQVPASLPKVPAQVRQVFGNWNFNTFGDFALAVRKHAIGMGTDRRLEISQNLASASTYGNEAVGADGGFAVPPDFRTAIMQKVMGEDSLLSRCDQISVTGNTFTCPRDETTPWQTTGGILAYWDSEASAATQSKPSLESTTHKLNKLRALVPVTEELMEDASAMDAYLRRKAPEKISFKVNLAILQGTGVGQPLGILNSGSTVTVSKESSQVADTIVGMNLVKMYSRMPAANLANAVWVMNQDCLPQIIKLALPGTDNEGNVTTNYGGLVYTPPGGFSQAPYGTIFGRPVLFSQACETLGDLGDLFFVDLSSYMALLKSGPNPRVDISMHLWFDQDLIAYKFVLRMGGAPWWTTTMSARDGSATYSPYIILEAR